MTLDILQLLKDADKAAQKGDLEELKRLRNEALKAEGQTAEGVMEFFDSNFPENIFE